VTDDELAAIRQRAEQRQDWPDDVIFDMYDLVTEVDRLRAEIRQLRHIPDPATCSECGVLYQPAKKPQAGRAHYCPTCRGVDATGRRRNLAAKRRYAARVRL
jgi:predicted Zn-ribbon and HTH transcriptional regulator